MAAKKAAVEKAPVENSPEYERLAKVIEVYKKQSPVKYELKKAVLEAKLEALKGK